MVIGYTTGVYDLFHIGHLNLLKNARGLCDKLIVGVTVDKLVEYKNKRSVIPFEERIEIVRNIKWVDAAIPQESLDKFDAWEKLHFDILFVGDDWYNAPSWRAMEEKFKTVGVRVVYFPYTKGISSTIISHALRTLRSDEFDPKTASMKDSPFADARAFCMSSYLMFRYVVDPTKSFGGQLRPRVVDISFPRTPIRTGDELISALKSKVEAATADGKAALALSGGIDSAILAKFMPEGSTAYTFRCVVPGKQVTDESARARAIADACRLKHKIVDITWDDQISAADILMKHKHAPIHSIEAQIYKAALQIKTDGFSKFILGENADIIYGGMDGLLAKDWTVGEFIERYSYVRLRPSCALTSSMSTGTSTGIISSTSISVRRRWAPIQMPATPPEFNSSDRTRRRIGSSRSTIKKSARGNRNTSCERRSQNFFRMSSRRKKSPCRAR